MSQKWKPIEKKKTSPSGRNFHSPRIVVWLLPPVTIFIIASITIALWYNMTSPGTSLSGPVTRPVSRSKSRKVDPFVTKSGTQLMVNGSPLHLVGYNWHWMGTGCLIPTDAEIDTTFAEIKTTSHGNVVRTAFYQSGSNNGAYTDFDRYIKYARKND